MAHPKKRGTEPPGTIHLPAIGPVPHTRIRYFVGSGFSSYCYVQLIDKPEPILLSEALGYFQKRLPDFIRRPYDGCRRRELINPLYQ